MKQMEKVQELQIKSMELLHKQDMLSFGEFIIKALKGAYGLSLNELDDINELYRVYEEGWYIERDNAQ